MIDKDALFEKVLQAYAAFKTFRCRATLSRTIETDVKVESLFAMRLAFSRPGNIFLQWWLDEPRETKHRVVIATGKLVIEHSFGDLEWKHDQSIEDILASHAGVSSGLSLHVPSLLVGYQEYTLFERVESVDRTTDQGCESYLLSGVASNAVKRTLRIRESDLAIMGMTERFNITNGRVTCESEYTNIEASS